MSEHKTDVTYGTLDLLIRMVVTPAESRCTGFALLNASQGNARAYQVRTDLDGLAQFGLGLDAIVESQVSEAGEVVGIGEASARRLRAAAPSAPAIATRDCRWLRSGLSGFHQARKECFGLIRLTQFLERHRLIVRLDAAHRVARRHLASATARAAQARRFRPMPSFDGLLVVAQTFVRNSRPVRHFRIPHAAAGGSQWQIRGYRHRSLKIG